MVASGNVSALDPELVAVTDDPEDAVALAMRDI